MREKATVATAVVTIMIVVGWRALFVTWAPPTTFQFDMAERILHPWWGLSWIAVGALWIAMLFDARVIWMPLTSIALVAVTLQAFAGVTFALERPLDGAISLTGAALAGLSVVEVAALLGWIGMLLRWKLSRA